MHAALPLYAEFVLLATRPDGTRTVSTQLLDAALAGAVLSDLATEGAIDLRDGIVVASGVTRPDDAVLAARAEVVATEPRLRKTAWWVRRWAGRPLSEEVLATMVADGLLRVEHVRVLGLFPATRHPVLDPSVEPAVLVRMAAVLSGEAEPDSRTASLIALCSVTGLLRTHFGRVDRATVKRITEGEWASPAVRQVIAETNAAMMAALVATAAAGASSGS
jgi:hypothetical protein